MNDVVLHLKCACQLSVAAFECFEVSTLFLLARVHWGMGNWQSLIGIGLGIVNRYGEGVDLNQLIYALLLCVLRVASIKHTRSN